MSATVAMAQLNDARKAVLARWQHVANRWRDPAAERFQEQIIDTIDHDLRQVISAMNHAHNLVQKARQECS